MARGIFTKIDGNWIPIAKVFTKVNADWQEVVRAYTKVNADWQQVFPRDTPPPDLPAGTYTLSATALSLPTTSRTGFAEFDTVIYRGRITEIRQTVSWKSGWSTDQDADTSGRPNGNFYRNIANNNSEFDNRTIDHRIDTFDATSLTDFNSGAAIGFTFTSSVQSFFIGNLWSNVQLKLTIV